MRADARDNRARVLTAAEKVFGTDPDASTEAVAKLAGVGIGTVFRHFPAKRDLLEAVLTVRLERLAEQARALAEAADPGRAFYDFFDQVVTEAPGKLAVADALVKSGATAGPSAKAAGAALREAFAELLTRAQAAGAVQADAGFAEVYALLVGTSRGAIAVDLNPADRDALLALAHRALRP
ncbi:TetR/AcrR family transcriptional regulator [Kribbella sp. NBC_01245]|uniref:TetR/AcrR family transcriptional regulator n=1 Tax=Kribbella sp. NBC_01245 TaxID=2903578 RepID=UPI002E2B190F|nr:helix-turn-helix domain-containing protein [Kribbella sp. NBC_01245]